MSGSDRGPVHGLPEDEILRSRRCAQNDQGITKMLMYLLGAISKPSSGVNLNLPR